MTSKLLSRSLKLLSLLLILIAVAALLLSMLLKDLDHYSRQALQYFEDATGYRVTFTDISMHFERGAGLRIDGFTLVHKDSGRELLHGDHLYVRIKLRHLLKKKITIHQLLIEDPHIRVYRDIDGSWQSFFSALMAPDLDETGGIFGDYHVALRNLSLLNGILEVRDELHDSAVHLNNCDIRLHRAEDDLFQMQMSAQHYANGSQGSISYRSEFHRSLFRKSGPDTDLQTLLTSALEFSNMPMRECLSYLPDRFEMPVDGGLLDGAVDFELKQNQLLSAEGDLALRDAQVHLPALERVAWPEIRLAFKVDMSRSAIRWSEFSLQLEPGAYLSGSAGIENIDTEKPDFALHIASGTLNVREIAARVAASDPRRFAWLTEICKRMSEGTVLVHELDLAVPLGTAYKPEAIRLQARLGVAGLGYTADLLPHLSFQPGSSFSLEFERGQLQAQGQVHLLPGDRHDIDCAVALPGGKVRLDCTITSRLIPASINALLDGFMGASAQSTVAMQQGSIALRTDIHLEDGLRVASDIDATDAAYSLAGAIGKPQGVANTIRLDYEQEKSSVSMPFIVKLADTLSTSGRLRYADGFAVEGQFVAKDCTLQTFSFPFLPAALSLDGLISGRGDYVFPLKDDLRPVRAALKLDGIALSDTSAEKPLIRVDAALDFSSPSGPINVSDGRVAAGATRGAFEGKLNSLMPLVGTFSAPMDVYDIDDFVQLILDIVRSAEKKDTAPAPASDDSPGMFAQMDINVDLTSRQTTYLDWYFGPGRSDFSIKNKRMFWDAVDIECGNGTLNGSVLYDLSNPDHFRLEFVIDRTDVDVTWAIPAFRKKKTITGRLNLQSRFSSNFKTSKELLNNMEGTFDFVVKDGKIEKMTLVSNILNTLNVAQLLAFKMPEFSKQGMPFDSMSGLFLLKDLQLSTDDLLVQCPSMDFSVAGVLDFDVNELDLLIGVQIFRSVARVLGTIPYFGRKITGKGKTLTFTYLKAKGPFDQPSIIPIPSRVIDNAILKIFKSVWEVPQDLLSLPLGMIRLFTEDEADNATAH